MEISKMLNMPTFNGVTKMTNYCPTQNTKHPRKIKSKRGWGKTNIKHVQVTTNASADVGAYADSCAYADADVGAYADGVGASPYIGASVDASASVDLHVKVNAELSYYDGGLGYDEFNDLGGSPRYTRLVDYGWRTCKEVAYQQNSDEDLEPMYYQAGRWRHF